MTSNKQNTFQPQTVDLSDPLHVFTPGVPEFPAPMAASSVSNTNPYPVFQDANVPQKPQAPQIQNSQMINNYPEQNSVMGSSYQGAMGNGTQQKFPIQMSIQQSQVLPNTQQQYPPQQYASQQYPQQQYPSQQVRPQQSQQIPSQQMPKYIPNSSVYQNNVPSFENGIRPPNETIIVGQRPIIAPQVVPMYVPMYVPPPRPYCPRCGGSGYKYNGRRCICNGGIPGYDNDELLGMALYYW